MFEVSTRQVDKSNSSAFKLPTREELRFAIVDQVIRPVVGGRVRYQGSTWRAHEKSNLTLNVGDIVRVIGRVGNYLFVEKKY